MLAREERVALTGEEQDRIWEYFQNEAEESFVNARPRIEFLLRRIPAGARALNIGVGARGFEKAALAKGVEVYSLDPNARAIEKLRQECGLGDRARVGYGQSAPFDDAQFDFVVVSEVLEHLTDDVLRGTLSEVRRILKPGGRLLGTTPARENLDQQRVLCPHCAKTFHRWGHEQSITVEKMRSWLEPHFEVETVTEKVFVSWGTLNWRGKIVEGLRLLRRSLGMPGETDSLFFVARKPAP